MLQPGGCVYCATARHSAAKVTDTESKTIELALGSVLEPDGQRPPELAVQEGNGGSSASSRSLNLQLAELC